MNRKNTILIAVMINAGLLAVLLIVAMAMQEDLPLETPVAKQGPIELQLPSFDDVSSFKEIASLTLPEIPQPSIEPLILHKLPQIIEESQPAPISPPPPGPGTINPHPSSPFALAEANEVIVKKGDSLDKIAKLNHTSVDEIIKLNQLPSTFLKVGQVLKIPKEKGSLKVLEKATNNSNSEYYTMKVGENPWAIAQKHHMKVEDLLKLNGLNEERARKLKPGDRLRIK